MNPVPRYGGVFFLFCLLLCLCGCSERFAGRDGDAASSGSGARRGGLGAAAAKPTLRVNLAGLPGIDEAQAAALARAWETASGVRTEIASRGTGAADVIIVSSTTLGDAVDAKQIAALSGDSPDARIPAAARRALTLGGETYALPLTARLRVLAYDPERLRRAGLDDRPAPTLEGLRAQWQEAVRPTAAPPINSSLPAAGKSAAPLRESSLMPISPPMWLYSLPRSGVSWFRRTAPPCPRLPSRGAGSGIPEDAARPKSAFPVRPSLRAYLRGRHRE